MGYYSSVQTELKFTLSQNTFPIIKKLGTYSKKGGLFYGLQNSRKKERHLVHERIMKGVDLFLV